MKKASSKRALPADGAFSRLCARLVEREGRVVGIGVDMAEISDFTDSEINQIFFRRLFTDSEKSYIDSFSPEQRPARRALVFSAKEAAFKALGDGLRGFCRRHPGEKPKAAFVSFTIDMPQGRAIPTGVTAETVTLLGIECINIDGFCGDDGAFTAAAAVAAT